MISTTELFASTSNKTTTMPTPTAAAATKRKSDDVDIAAADGRMKIINVHIGGATIPIIHPPEMRTQTWGELCKDVVQNSLMAADPKLILKILSKICPKERLTHYVMRYGGGHSSIIRVDWSSFTDIIPAVPAYMNVNVVLRPRSEGAWQNTAKAHLALQPVRVERNTSMDVDLCIYPVSKTEISFPSNPARTSVLYLNEHKHFPGCVDSYKVVAADGLNDILPPACMTEAPLSAAPIILTDISPTTVTVGRKRTAPLLIGDDISEEATTPKKSKLYHDGDDDDVSNQVTNENEESLPVDSSSSFGGSSSPETKDAATSNKGMSIVKNLSAPAATDESGDGGESCIDFGNTDYGGDSSVEFGKTDICIDSTVTAPPNCIDFKAKSKDIKKVLHHQYHPITKLQMRNCICGSSECRKIVWQYASMGNEKMTKYIVIPNRPPKADKKVRKYKLKFLDHIAKYFPHWVIKPKSKKTVDYLSITHFPPSHRDVLWKRPKGWTERWRIPLSVGRMSGLNDHQKCRFVPDIFFFASPMLHRDAIAMELGDAIRAVLRQKRGTVLNDKQSELLEKFQESNGYTPITENDYGIHMNLLTAETLKTKSSPRLKGKQIMCQCKQNHPNCVHSECANNYDFKRECNRSNCSFGEADCGNRFTTPQQVKEQSRARFVVEEFKSDKNSDPRVGSGAKAVVPFSVNEIIGEYIGEVRKLEEGMSSNYCVDIGEGY
eukprot:scaffold222_cov90-Skeletonema_menzelii.AAC.1